MKSLLEKWDSFLNEGMITPESLPEDVVVVIDMKYYPEEVGFSFQYMENGKPVKYINRPSGNLLITKTSPHIHGRCFDSYIVSWSSAEKGWGPLLYDIAIEWATQRSKGLMPDRYSVSKEARSVWDFYLKKRKDVKATQLDSMENELTPSEDDNCKQDSSRDHKQEKWMHDSTSKIYSKDKPEMMLRMNKMGRLIMNMDADEANN